MQLILEAVAGAATGRSLVVRDGQSVLVGRTNWADRSVPEDAALSEVHFELRCDWRGCQIRDRDSASGTWVNGQRVASAALQDQDQVLAGETTFRVRILGQPRSSGESQPESGQAGPPPRPAAVYTRGFVWSDEAAALLEDELSPADYWDRLVSAALFTDAIRFLAAWLPKPAAVGWACACLREVGGASQSPTARAALEAAEAWAAEPEEAARRKAEAAAEACDYSGPEASVALAAFWSGGSLLGDDLPPVMPPETATAQVVSTALIVVAHQAPPDQVPSRYQAFLAVGKQQIT